jgi:hypothetical protein
MTPVNQQMAIVFYSTNDVKERLRIKSTQTLKTYRAQKGFPNPVLSNNGAHDLYSVQAVHQWEQQQLQKLVA